MKIVQILSNLVLELGVINPFSSKNDGNEFLCARMEQGLDGGSEKREICRQEKG